MARTPYLLFALFLSVFLATVEQGELIVRLLSDVMLFSDV